MTVTKQTVLFATILWIAGCTSTRRTEVPDLPVEIGRCNVVWTSPSRNAAGSMPIGNGEVGLNVWVEEDGDLLFYISRTDAWSECGRLLKLGRVRVHLTPNPFVKGAPFRQTLNLSDGRIEIAAGGVALKIFVDANHPVIHIMGESAAPVDVLVSLENWRTEKRRLKGQELESSWTMRGAPQSIDVSESADALWREESKDLYVHPPTVKEVIWYHRNKSSVVPLTLNHQGLTTVAQAVRDPLEGRTFGGSFDGIGFVREGDASVRAVRPVQKFAVWIGTHCAQTPDLKEWLAGLWKSEREAPPADEALKQTADWWHAFWNRSWIHVECKTPLAIPTNGFPLRVGVDSTGGSRFKGRIGRARAFGRILTLEEVERLALDDSEGEGESDVDFSRSFTLEARIKPAAGEWGRIFDKITAGGSDGFLLDLFPGLTPRLIVGSVTLAAEPCIQPDAWNHVAATIDSSNGTMRIFVNGKVVAQRKSPDVTQAYVLQRWITACGGRGAYPIKFNGSIFTVDPEFTGGPKFNADWRRWGDCYWWQNTRLPYHPMLASGDFDEMKPLFRFFEDAVPLCRARANLYHNVEGVYFPETMTIFGTYSNGDYGWDRKGHAPNDVQCPWWQYAWQQGLELVMIMLDYYEHTGDEKFLTEQLLPMAREVLRYFESRFFHDAKLVIKPTQAVETYWFDVVNDTPTVAGLRAVLPRLLALKISSADRDSWRRLFEAAPPLPCDLNNHALLPAQAYKNTRNNVENPELYAVWPFRIACGLLGDLGKNTYARRVEKSMLGWSYDGQCAALLGLADEAARQLFAKAANSNPRHRFPAMWGPNYDWLPDQCHGGNLMLTLQYMVMQAVGDEIYLLPAWPKNWNVSFKLHAPRNTLIEGEWRDGRMQHLRVTPPEREKDVVAPK